MTTLECGIPSTMPPRRIQVPSSIDPGPQYRQGRVCCVDPGIHTYFVHTRPRGPRLPISDNPSPVLLPSPRARAAGRTIVVLHATWRRRMAQRPSLGTASICKAGPLRLSLDCPLRHSLQGLLDHTLCNVRPSPDRQTATRRLALAVQQQVINVSPSWATLAGGADSPPFTFVASR